MSAPQHAAAAVAADISLQQGDFMECLVETTVRSMFSQLRAEYQRELQKVLEAANRGQTLTQDQIQGGLRPHVQDHAAQPRIDELTSFQEDPDRLRQAGQSRHDDDPADKLPAGKLPGAVMTTYSDTEQNDGDPSSVVKGRQVTTSTAATGDACERMSVVSCHSAPSANYSARPEKKVKSLKMANREDHAFKLTGKEEAMLNKLRQDEERAIGTGFSYAQSFKRTSTRVLLSSGASYTKLWAYQIITRRSFDFAMGLIIIANAVSIGMETSITVHGGELPASLVACEYVFLFVYICELALRFHAVGIRTAMQSGWVKFDAILVLAGVINLFMIAASAKGELAETVDNVNMLKLLRLFRLARTVRVFVQFRTLWLLVQGLMGAALPMLWTSLIMFIVTYVFAIIGMESIFNSNGNSEYIEAATNFTSVWSSMLTLMQFMFLDSIQHLYLPLVNANPFLTVYFACFILIGPIALMSIVTAILVESSLRTANEDLEAKKAWDAIKKKEMVPKLRQLFATLDTNSDGDVDLAELLATSDDVKEQIQRIVALEEMEEIFHMLDIDHSGAVSIDEFIDGIMRSQDDKPSELIVLVKQGRAILEQLQALTSDK